MKQPHTKSFLALLLAGALCLFVAGCGGDDMDDMEDAAEEAAEETGDAIQDAGDAIEDATD